MTVIHSENLIQRRHAPAAGLFGWHRAAECTGRCIEANPERFSALYAQPCTCRRPRRFDSLPDQKF